MIISTRIEKDETMQSFQLYDAIMALGVLISGILGSIALILQRRNESKHAIIQAKKTAAENNGTLTSSALAWTQHFSEELKEMRDLNQTMQLSIQAYQKDVTDLKLKNIELCQKVGVLEKENKTLGDKIVVLEGERREMTARIKTLECENTNLHSELNKMKGK